jgi:hypothetical protein
VSSYLLNLFYRYWSKASFSLAETSRVFTTTAFAALSPRNSLTLLRSYGTAKSGVGISAMAVLRPDLMMKNVVPVVMAGIIAVSTYTPLETATRLNFGADERSTALSSRFLSPEIVCIP